MVKRLVILQTCDGVVYRPFLDLTEPVHRRYADRHGYGYVRHDGVIRGVHACHAAFNRYYLLRELIAEGEWDWALYLDADAVVVDPDRCAEEFLEPGRLIVACRGGTTGEPWDINNGVMFYNLRHVLASAVAECCIRSYEFLTPESLAEHDDGRYQDRGNRLSDQAILHGVLKSLPGGFFAGAVKVFTGKNHDAFNYGGPYIRQVIRGGKKPMTVGERLEVLKGMLI